MRKDGNIFFQKENLFNSGNSLKIFFWHTKIQIQKLTMISMTQAIIQSWIRLDYI